MRGDIPAELEQVGQHVMAGRIRYAGLTQQELSARTGIAQPEISKIESGRRLPTLAQLFRIAGVLGLPVQFFVSGCSTPGEEGRDLLFELSGLGIVDLVTTDARVPGAFRAKESVVALAIAGDQPDPRIVEAIPAVLAWNAWNKHLLLAECRQFGKDPLRRIAWLSDIALTIDRAHGFPGGIADRRSLSGVIRAVGPIRGRTKEASGGRREGAGDPDSLGYPGDESVLPPVSRRWGVTYGASLEQFRGRAVRLQELRLSRGGLDPWRRGTLLPGNGR